MDGKYLEWIYFLQKIITGCNIFFSCKTFFCSVWTVGKKNRIFFVSSWIFFFCSKGVRLSEKKVRGKGHFLKCFCIFFTAKTQFHTWKTKQNLCFAHEKLFFSWKKEIHYKHISHTDFFFPELFSSTLFLTHENKKKFKKKFHKKIWMIMQNFFFHQFSSNKHRKENCSDRN